MQQLVETSSVLATAGALPDERGVRGKDDSFSHSAIALATDLTIAKLDWQQKKKVIHIMAV